MFNMDMVEPTDHLYQEGNIIGRHLREEKRKTAQRELEKEKKKKSLEKKSHKYQKESLGNFIDIEV